MTESRLSADLARLLEEDDRDAPTGPAPYYEAVALVGVEIDPQKLMRCERVRACACLEQADAPDNPLLAQSRELEWDFCPWCGKPLYETQMKTIPQWDSSDPARPLLAGLCVVATAQPGAPGLELTDLGREAIRKGARFFVGEIVARTDAAAPARLAPVTSEMLADAKARVGQRLDPLGLWDPKKFGVWAVLNVVR